MYNQSKLKNNSKVSRDIKFKPNYVDLENLKKFLDKNYNLNERFVNDCDKYYRK